MNDDQPLLTISEVSVWIRAKESTIRKWVCYNRIPYIKIGRLVLFKSEDIKIWMKQNNPQREKWNQVYEAYEKSYNEAVR